MVVYVSSSDLLFHQLKVEFQFPVGIYCLKIWGAPAAGLTLRELSVVSPGHALTASVPELSIDWRPCCASC